MNNSSSEGQLFYSQVTTPFTVYPVTTCDDAEGVSGTDAQVPGLGNENGFTAISNDMATNSSQTGRCTKNSIR
jgi:hypothetical protein